MGRKLFWEAEVLGTWGQLAQGRSPERFERGTPIYTPDQAAQDVLLLSNGQVGLFLSGPEDRTLMLREVEPGQLFGHMALTGDETYDTHAEALAPSLLYRIPHTEAVELMNQDPDLALALLDDVGQHRAAVSRRLDDVGFKSVPARLASVLLDMAGKSHGNSPHPRLPRRSHRQLAEMVNAYRETVTKIINQFRAAHLLEIDRATITLLNRTVLEELAQGY